MLKLYVKAFSNNVLLIKAFSNNVDDPLLLLCLIIFLGVCIVSSFGSFYEYELSHILI